MENTFRTTAADLMSMGPRVDGHAKARPLQEKHYAGIRPSSFQSKTLMTMFRFQAE